MPTYPIGGRTAPQSPNGGQGDHLMAGIKQLLAFPLTTALAADKAGQDLAYGASGQHPPGTSQVNDMLDIIDKWAHQESGPPQTYGQQALELAPAVATAPGLAMKALTVTPTLISDAINSSTFMAGLGLAGESEAGVINSVPSSAPKLEPGSLSSQGSPQVTPVTSSPAPKLDLGSETPQTTPDGALGVPLGSLSPEKQLLLKQPAAGIEIHDIHQPIEISDLQDPFQKSPDVQRTDEHLGKAPYDDSTDYGKRAEYLMYGLLGLGGIALGAGGYKLLRESPIPAGDVAGTVYPGSARDASLTSTDPMASVGGQRGPVTNLPTLLATQFIDHMAPQRAALELAPAGPVRDDLIARLNTLQSHSLDGMVNDFHKTGRMPGSNIKVDVPTAQVAEAVKALPPEKQTAFNDLTTLNTRIDQSYAAYQAKYNAAVAAGKAPAKLAKLGPTPWAVGTPEAMTYRDMITARSKLMTDHPEVVPFVEQYHDLYRQVPKYAEQQGAIDAATRARFERDNPNFAPQHRQYADKWYQTIFGRTGDASNKVGTDFLEFDPRGDLKSETLRPGEVGDPFKAAQDYFDGLFRATMINKYRADFASFIDTHGQARYGGRYTQILTKEPHDPMINAVPYYAVGKRLWLRVDDPMLYSSLMWRPREVFRVAATANRMAAQTITGKLNPVFAPIAAQFDTIMAPLMLPSGTDIGPLSRIMKALGAKRGLSSFDPTNMLMVPHGGFSKLWGDISYNAWTGFSKDLQSNGIISSTLGPENVKTLSEMMRNAYERSTASLGERYGALGSSRYTVMDNTKTTPEVLSGLPGFRGIGSSIAHVPGVNVYNSIVDAIRDGAKLQFMATNIERVPTWRTYQFQWGTGAGLRTYQLPMLEWLPKSETNLKQVASQTRRLFGDTGEIGGDTTTQLGYYGQKLNSSIMYGNQAVQETAQLWRMAKDHPTRFGATVLATLGSGVAAWHYAMSQPTVRKELEGMTPEQRSRVVPIAIGDKLLGMVHVPPFYRPFMGPAVHGYLGLHGMLPKGEYEGMGDLTEIGLKSILNDYLPNMTGPAPFIAAAEGKRLMPNSLTPVDPRQNELQNANDPDYQSSVAAWMDNGITTLTGTAFQSGLAAIDGAMQAMRHNMGVKDPSHKLDPSKVAAQDFFGPFQESKQTGVFNQLWGVGTKAGVSNQTYEKVQRTVLPALTAIIDRGSKSIKTGGTRMISGTPSPQGVTGDIPNDIGTQFQPVYLAATQLQKQLAPLKTQYHELSIQQQQLTTNPIYADPKLRMTIGNQLTKQQTELNGLMLMAIRAKEAELGKVIPGFTFGNWQATVR